MTPQTALQIVATAFVVILIVLPIPPSTMIGLALVAHPRTNRYLEPRTIAAVQMAMGVVFGPARALISILRG